MGLFIYFYFIFDKLIGFMSFASGNLTVLLTLWPCPFYGLGEHAIYKPVSFIASSILCTLLSLSFLWARRLYSFVHVVDLMTLSFFITISIWWDCRLYSFVHFMDLMTSSFLWARRFYSFIYVVDLMTLSFLYFHLFDKAVSFTVSSLSWT